MNCFLRLYARLMIILLCLPTLAQGTQNSQAIQSFNSSISDQIISVDNLNRELLDRLSEEELHWYNKFQHGLMFFNGWKDISKDIIASLPNEEKFGIQKLLDNLGMRIGYEWSKANNIRRIDTDQLRSWGKRLQKARSTGADNLKETVYKISSEVETILLQKE